MARSRYEYSTSPRKLEPEYKPQQKQNKKRKLHVVEDLPRQGIKISTEQKKKRTKATLVVIAIFALLLTISYRNSKINEKFTEVQSLKKELSSLQKENEQLKVNIENSLNFNNIEIIGSERGSHRNGNENPSSRQAGHCGRKRNFIPIFWFRGYQRSVEYRYGQAHRW